MRRIYWQHRLDPTPLDDIIPADAPLEHGYWRYRGTFLLALIELGLFGPYNPSNNVETRGQCTVVTLFPPYPIT